MKKISEMTDKELLQDKAVQEALRILQEKGVSPSEVKQGMEQLTTITDEYLGYCAPHQTSMSDDCAYELTVAHHRQQNPWPADLDGTDEQAPEILEYFIHFEEVHADYSDGTSELALRCHDSEDAERACYKLNDALSNS